MSIFRYGSAPKQFHPAPNVTDNEVGNKSAGFAHKPDSLKQVTDVHSQTRYHHIFKSCKRVTPKQNKDVYSPTITDDKGQFLPYIVQQ